MRGLVMAVLGTVVATVMVPSSAGAVKGLTCSELKADCQKFCAANPQRKVCPSACLSAHTECMRSGEWHTTSTHLTGRVKK